MSCAQLILFRSTEAVKKKKKKKKKPTEKQAREEKTITGLGTCLIKKHSRALFGRITRSHKARVVWENVRMDGVTTSCNFDQRESTL